MKDKTRQPQTARSLTATLAIAFVVLSVVMLLISSGLQVLSNLQAQQETIAGQQQLIAQDAARTVASFIQDKFSVLDTTARLANPVTASPEAQKQIIESLLGPQPAIRQLVLLNAQGQELVKASRLSQTASGRLAERLPSDTLAQLRKGERYISPVYIDPITSEPLIVMAVPATNPLREFQGILAAEVNLKVDLWDLIDRLKVGETGLAYVVDRQGNLIAFSDTARVLRGENVGHLKTVGEFIRRPATARPTEASIYSGIKGTTVVGSYIPLGTPDWAVVTELPWQEAYREAIRVAAASLGITLTLAALAGLLGVVVARRLAVPLVNLTGTATRIARGEIELQAAVSGPREVASLASAFNSMTQQLRNLISGLEQRVEERTRELARRSSYLEATARVAREASATLDAAQLLPRIVNLISEQFGFYHAGIFLIDTSGEWAELQAASSEGGQRMLARKHRLRVEERGIVGYTAHSGQARIALDTGADRVFLQNPYLPDTRSEMALPLRARGEIIGVLDVQSTFPQAFSEEDVAVLQTLADQVALAISNARLFQQVQESLEAERRAYGELSRQAWRQLLRTRPGLGFVSDQKGTVPADKELKPEMKQAIQARQLAVAEGDGTALALPIQVRGQVIGVVDIQRPAGSGEWAPDQIAVIQTLAEQLGVALESARLYQDTQRRAVRERLVGEVTARVRESLDMDTVLKTAVQEIVQSLDLPEVTIRMAPPSKEQVAYKS